MPLLTGRARRGVPTSFGDYNTFNIQRQAAMQQRQFTEMQNRYNQMLQQTQAQNQLGPQRPPANTGQPPAGQAAAPRVPSTGQPTTPQGPPTAWGDPLTGTVFPASQWINGQPPQGANLVPLWPAQTAQPATPATPAAPAQPPGQPATPAIPAQPAQPAQPTAQPAQPAATPAQALPPGWVMINGVAVNTGGSRLGANNPLLTQQAQTSAPSPTTPQQPMPQAEQRFMPPPPDNGGFVDPMPYLVGGQPGTPKIPGQTYGGRVFQPPTSIPPDNGGFVDPMPTPMPIIQSAPVTPVTAPPALPGGFAAPSDLAQRQMEAAMKGLPLPVV